MKDDLDGLSEYLGAFSSLGSVPTSLMGYGYSGRHEAELSALGASAPRGPGWDTEAVGSKPPLSVWKKYNCQSRCTERYRDEWTPYAVKDISRDLIAVKALKGKPTSSWSAVAPAWKAYAQSAKLYPEAEPAQGGTFSSDFVWINRLARAQLAKNAAAAGVPPTAQQKSTSPTPAPKAAGNQIVLGTAAVQDILIRLGWRGKDTTKGAVQKSLTDGLYGSAVATNWQQSAKKRKLDPSIAKKASDGTTVTVNEATYYALKTLADQLVPPTQQQPTVVQPPAAATAETTEKRLNEVLGRLSGAPAGATLPWDQLVALYQKAAKGQNLDPRIEKVAVQCFTTPCPPDRVVVNADTWKVLMAAYDKAAPAPPPVAPSEKQNVDAAMGQIAKQATEKVSSATLQNVFNIAIEAKTIKRDKFTGDRWSSDYAPLLIKIINPTDAIWKKAWEQMLVPGKLVASDKTSVKLQPATAASLKKIESDYLAAKKQETERIAGYTKVNSAQIIESVNALNISTKTFDKSGGYKELADALKTFLDETKQTVVGDLVKVQEKTKDVFVKDEVLVKLAAAKKTAEDRQKATESYRKNMVAEALKASSQAVSIDDLQRAFIETVHSGKAGKNKDLYSAVKRNGSFDTATRAAYTELAREVTIGPSVQQFEKLAMAQLGPRYKTNITKQVRNDVWSEFLKQAVGKDSLKTLPALANTINAAAKVYKQRVSTEKDDKAKRAEADKLLADTVKKSNVIISIFDVQMGLLEPSKPKAVGVQTTGRGDEPTKVALFNLVSGMIFPTTLDKKKWSWDEYLDAVGIRVESNTSVKKGWTGANWVALPQAAADLLAKHAEKWLTRNALPPGYSGLVPLPLQNEELRLRFDKPSVIRVKRPDAESEAKKKAAEKKAAEKKAKAAKKKAAAAETKKKAKRAKEEAAKKRKEAEEAKARAEKNAADQKAQEEAARKEQEAKVAESVAAKAETEAVSAQVESAVADKDAQSAATSAGGAGGAVGPVTTGPVTAGGSEVNITFTDREAGPVMPTPAPAPTPEPMPTPAPEPAPAPVEPTQAGMGSGFLWLTLAGLGYMLFGPKDEKQTKRGGTRYSTPGGRP